MTDPASRPPLTLAEHEERLNKGWEWLKRYPNRRDWDTRFEMWLGWLKEYEQLYTAIERGTAPHMQGAFL